ncbi:MAG: hypothetical protein MUF20_05770 [Methylotetracoccus sp.]|nr:hypothetical protein [Methylotetracoccus sp.]
MHFFVFAVFLLFGVLEKIQRLLSPHLADPVAVCLSAVRLHLLSVLGFCSRLNPYSELAPIVLGDTVSLF